MPAWRNQKSARSFEGCGGPCYCVVLLPLAESALVHESSVMTSFLWIILSSRRVRIQVLRRDYPWN